MWCRVSRCAPWPRYNGWPYVVHTVPRPLCCNLYVKTHLGLGRSRAGWLQEPAAVRGQRKRDREKGVCRFEQKRQATRGTVPPCASVNTEPASRAHVVGNTIGTSQGNTRAATWL